MPAMKTKRRTVTWQPVLPAALPWGLEAETLTGGAFPDVANRFAPTPSLATLTTIMRQYPGKSGATTVSYTHLTLPTILLV
eukprot:5972232-Amphidinium_carterae.1